MSELYVGFYKNNVTPPKGGIPLGGWGSTHLRLAREIKDPLFCHVTAIGTEKGAELLLINIDLCTIIEECINLWRDALTEKIGFPRERIFISGTHTHAGPDMRSPLPVIAEYKEFCAEVMADTCKRAIADLKPTTVKIGRGEVGKPGTRLNHVRHYTMKNIQDPNDKTEYYSGNNFGFQYLWDPEKYAYTGHTSEADPEMQILEFDRGDSDSVILCNFQCHGVMTGGVFSPTMTSDFMGPFECALEKMIPHSHVVYIQGACGNVNPGTRIREEAILGLNFDPFRPNDDSDIDNHAYGYILASYAEEILRLNMKECPEKDFGFTTEHFTCECDHSLDDLLPKIQPVLDKYDKEGNTRDTIHMALSFGLHSPYHATSIRMKSKLPKTRDIELNAFHIGNVAFITAPFEMYDMTGQFIKTNSPFDMTLIQAYSCGHEGYVPAKNSCKETYERDNTKFIPGTAEKIADEYLALLKKLK